MRLGDAGLVVPWLHNPQETVLSTLSEKDSFFFSPETTRGGGHTQRMRKEDSGMGPKEGAVGWQRVPQERARPSLKGFSVVFLPYFVFRSGSDMGV